MKTIAKIFLNTLLLSLTGYHAASMIPSSSANAEEDQITIKIDLPFYLGETNVPNLGQDQDTTFKLKQGSPANIKIGTGIISFKGELTTELPFDVLKMLLCAALIQEKLTTVGIPSTIFYLIADHLAETHQNICPGDKIRIREITNKFEKIINDITTKLRISCKVVRSSEIAKTVDYQNLLTQVAEKLQLPPTAYETQQTALGLFMEQHMDVKIKVGWVPVKRSISSRDEMYFDQFLTRGGSKVQFAYTTPGQTFDGQCRSPYFHGPNDTKRLLLGCPKTLPKGFSARFQESYLPIIQDMLYRTGPICPPASDTTTALENNLRAILSIP